MGQIEAAIVPVTAFEQNCTLLFDGDVGRGVVIDPGGDVPVIRRALAQKGITVEAIWLTHGHIDHAGAAMELKDALEAPVIGPHRDDAPLLQGLADQARMFGLGGTVRNVTPDRWLDEGETVSFAGHVLEVRHCPGHAPGHVIFFNRDAGLAHVGDVLFRQSIGRTDLPGGNHRQLLESIRDKILPLGDEVQFICGHGPGGRVGEERRTNPFLRDIA